MSVIHELRFDLPQRVFSGMKSGTFIFYRWGIGFVLLLIIFGRRAGSLFKTNDLKLMVIRSIITVNLIKMLREKNGPVAV